MKIRIIKQLNGTIEGIALQRYRLGEVYEVAPVVANFLAAEGCAVFELREPPKTERRKTTFERA